MKYHILISCICYTQALDFYQLSETEAIKKGLDPLFSIAKDLLIPKDLNNYLNHSNKFEPTDFYKDCLTKSPNPKYYDERKIVTQPSYELDRYVWKGSFWSNNKRLEDFDDFVDPENIPTFIKNMHWFLDNFKEPFHNSGKFYYPPKGVREWHTNAYQGGPGWRMYIIVKTDNGESGLNIIDPKTKEIKKFKDLGMLSINIFRITDKKNPSCHCVYSKNSNRFSLGIKISENYIDKILK